MRVGTSSHLAGELFKIRAGIDIVHIPYKGNADAMTDLVGGQLQMVFTGMAPVTPLAKAGKVHALATTGRQRIPSMPEVPTIGESGIADAEVSGWYAMGGPHSIPRDILARVNLEIANAMKLPDIKEKFAQQDLEPDVDSPEHFAQVIRDEYARWTKVIRAAGIKLEH